MSPPTAIVFAYHNIGVRCISVLLSRGITIKAIITHTDSPSETIYFASVSLLAKTHRIPTYTPDNPNLAPFIARLRSLGPVDFVFSFYYRKLLSQEILDLSSKGSFNMHGSLLPKYRGRAPVNWAILKGEQETGASLHVMVKKADAGPLVDQMAVPILENDTSEEVMRKVEVAAEIVLYRSLPGLVDQTAVLVPMDLKKGAYFGGRSEKDGEFKWDWPTKRIHDLVRAVTRPYPGAFGFLPDGSKLIIWRTLRVSEGTTEALKSQIHDLSSDNKPILVLLPQGCYLRAEDGYLLQILDAELNGKPYGFDGKTLAVELA